jgi:hypothetical protein
VLVPIAVSFGYPAYSPSSVVIVWWIRPSSDVKVTRMGDEKTYADLDDDRGESFLVRRCAVEKPSRAVND